MLAYLLLECICVCCVGECVVGVSVCAPNQTDSQHVMSCISGAAVMTLVAVVDYELASIDSVGLAVVPRCTQQL